MSYAKSLTTFLAKLISSRDSVWDKLNEHDVTFKSDMSTDVIIAVTLLRAFILKFLSGS